jgi:amphi-Trp domain-containing protein
MEKVVSDVRLEQKQSLSRKEAARFIAQLAEGLADDGTVTVALGSSTLEFSVSDQLRCELEVAVDGDEIELELELKWSSSDGASAQKEGGEEASGEEVDDSAQRVPPQGRRSPQERRPAQK